MIVLVGGAGCREEEREVWYVESRCVCQLAGVYDSLT